MDTEEKVVNMATDQNSDKSDTGNEDVQTSGPASKSKDKLEELKKSSMRLTSSIKSSYFSKKTQVSQNMEKNSQKFNQFLDLVKTKTEEVIPKIIPPQEPKADKRSRSEEKDRPSPSFILGSNKCKAHTLSISDQHATILITHVDNNSNNQSKEGHTTEEEQTSSLEGKEKPTHSLLKLTLVPFHRSVLGHSPVTISQETGQPDMIDLFSPPPIDTIDIEQMEKQEKASNQILAFLKGYDYTLTSESGAEYSYYNATPGKPTAKKFFEDAIKNVQKNVAGLKNKQPSSKMSNETTSGGSSENTGTEPTDLSDLLQLEGGSFKVELISPAAPRQIQRSMPSPSTSLVHETPSLYQTVTLPLIKSIVDSNSLDWIQNVINGTKEKERLLVDSNEYIVNIDTKWRSHPDPLTVPREEWKDHEAVRDLYCLGIVKSSSIRSLRDLRGEHIPMLQSLQQDGLRVIKEIYGVENDQVRVFVHYQPQFYHFHVHFTRLENEVGCSVERGHLISDILQNLELDTYFYVKRTICYRLRVTDRLYQLIEEESSKVEEVDLDL